MASKRILGPTLGLVAAAGSLLFAPSPARAGFGGGYGDHGSGIWASAWWAGNPEGPGPYTGPQAEAADLCAWHDVGGTVADLGEALGGLGLPQSFWTVPLGGGHPGIWGVLRWATSLAGRSKASDHFDLVVCPSPAELPPNGGDAETDLPTVKLPDGSRGWAWILWDTVPDPPAGALPPVVDQALSRVQLPAPSLSTSPSVVRGVRHATLVNLPTWLWVSLSIWHTYTATATAGPVVATVWAEPVSVTWSASWNFPVPSSDPEGGTTFGPERLEVTCDGPGVAYRPSDGGAAAPGACEAVFAQSSLGTWQELRADLTWVVRWALSDTAGVVGGEGLLPSLTTSGRSSLRVMQVESVVTSG